MLVASCARFGTALGAVLVLALVVAEGASSQTARGRHWFQTPSGNIKCIAVTTWAAETRPHLTCAVLSTGSKAAWPKQFTMKIRGRAHWWRPSDTEVRLSSRVLRYGSTVRFFARGRLAFTCRSRKRGLTCRNRSHHGFFLSRDKQRLF